MSFTSPTFPKSKVYFVGAGPGNLELLTLKAARLLETADVVAYDDLVNPALLELCPSATDLLAVGYRSGTPRGVLPILDPRLLKAIDAGKKVVRLKAGDPFVLARGGEEAQELIKLGVEFEFVPGITAGLGAASYGGIPLTHRGVATGFVVRTGHGSTATSYGDLTHVFYMVRKRLGETSGEMIRNGWDPSTPAAFVLSATLPTQRVVQGTLFDIDVKVMGLPTDAPGLLVVGDVVDFRASMDWYQPQDPLSGRRVLLARARPGSSSVGEGLKVLGADVVESPIITDRPLVGSQRQDLTEIFSELEGFQGVIFSSVAGVEHFMAAFLETVGDMRRFPLVDLVAVGKGVAAKLTSMGLEVALQVNGSCDRDIVSNSHYFRGGQFLHIVSQRGRPKLAKSFRDIGAQVVDIVGFIYRSQPVRVVAPLPDIVVAPSSSSLQLLVEGSGVTGVDITKLPVVTIGSHTSTTAVSLGFEKIYECQRDQPASLVELVTSVLMKLGEREAASAGASV